MVGARESNCSELTESARHISYDLEDLFGEMHIPSIPLVPIAEVSSESVQGRLREHSSFWLNELEGSDFVRGIVQHGYRIPFLAYPAPVFRFNHQSALQNEQFVSSEIRDLVAKRCVLQCSEPPLVCSPLSVVQNDKGKQRLVIDLRYVNQYLPVQKFKYEGLNLVPQLFRKEDFFFTFDLKSGYHHIDIHRLLALPWFFVGYG